MKLRGSLVDIFILAKIYQSFVHYIDRLSNVIILFKTNLNSLLYSLLEFEDITFSSFILYNPNNYKFSLNI